MDKHERLPSILYIIWSMHLQGLKLLCPTVYGEMHLQEIFDLTLTKVKGTWGIALYIMWSMYLQSLKLLWLMVKEMHYHQNTLFVLDPWPKVKVTQNVA